MRKRESRVSSLRIGFLLMMVSMSSRNLLLLQPGIRAWELRIHEKTSALIKVSSWLFFLLSLRTRANVLYAAHSTIIRQQQRLFGRAIVASHFIHPSVWKLSCKRWVDGKGRRGKRSRVDCVQHIRTWGLSSSKWRARDQIYGRIRKRKKEPRMRKEERRKVFSFAL